jgi:mediator of RNA polymerase II transcription subunit 17
MASCGVTTRQNLIQIPVADDLEILLDLVDVNDESLHAEQDSSQDDVVLAGGVAHSIRILLSFAHRQNLHRRTQVPLPLTPKRRPNPEYHLLRPALAYLQHTSEARYLESFIRDIVSTLRSSGFQVPEFTAQMFSNWKLPHPRPSPNALEGLISSSLKPIESVFQGKLLTPNSSFTVRMRTNMSFPPFGTHYDVSFNLPSVPDLKSPGNLSLREEVEAAVAHLLLLDVVMNISSAQVEEKPTEPDTPAKRWWDPIYPHMGELLIAYDHPEKHKKMRIVLSRDQLSLETYLVRCIDGIGIGTAEGRSQHTETKTWNLQQSLGSPNQQSSAMDFVIAEAST